MPYRILYFCGPILAATAEVETSDVVQAAQVASGDYPELTAEIWHDDRKVAVCRPSRTTRFKYRALR